jgi:CRP-like cAMP-binding protein
MDHRLREVELLSHFSDEQIAQLSRCTSRVRYPEGAIVLKEGDTTIDAYLIDRGEVRIHRDTPYGTYVLADLGPGELFGETSFIDQSARSGDALVLVDTALFPLNSLALSAMTERDRRFTLALYWTFWKSLSKKLRRANESLGRFDFGGGEAAPPLPAAPEAGSADFRVGLHAKQDLFREQKLSSLEINFLSTLSKEKRLAAGEVLFREGDPGEHLYVVLEGQVRISKNLSGAGEEALAIMGRGDYFGEMALIDEKPRSADARAHDDGAVVLAIPSEALRNILDPGKVSSLRLLKILCGLISKRLREIDDKLVSWFIFSGGAGTSLGIPEV